jgi:hypothetical protein
MFWIGCAIGFVFNIFERIWPALHNVFLALLVTAVVALGLAARRARML